MPNNLNQEEMYRCTIIGLSDSQRQWFSPDVIDIIAQGKIFSGGIRHHDIVKEILPKDAVWINVTVPLTDVYKEYEKHDEIIIFASGDPLFYGLAGTLKRVFPTTDIQVYPSFNSLQMLAHKMCLPYQDMHAVSLTGRPWDKFDEALINGEPLIGCLTDRRHTPHAIWQRMIHYGYDNYTMTVGENLGNESKERIGLYDESREYSIPNCIILQQQTVRRKRLGIPDTEFYLLNGREKMITKMPVRLATISALNLHERCSMWDIGFCTGSISIEARLAFPHLHITAFEIREEGKQLMELNSQKHHAPGIEYAIADFTKLDITPYPAPDAVFIGGYGGKMREIIQKAYSVLIPNGCIVFNSVSEKSKEEFCTIAKEMRMEVEMVHTIKSDDNNPITILRATKADTPSGNSY